MTAAKRNLDGSAKPAVPSSMATIQAFEYFRAELDEHHDRRERVIKASRDITAQSKKMIFSLQRVRTLGKPIGGSIAREVGQRRAEISRLFESIAGDLAEGEAEGGSRSSLNGWRYGRNVSGGVQEFVEAAAFEHYLGTQRLLAPAEARAQMPPAAAHLLRDADYLLGLLDATGEIMRFAVTGMATGGAVPGGEVVGQGEDASGGRNVLADLRALRSAIEGLDLKQAGDFREAEKKIQVMRASVEKVENAVYGLIVRGRERPKGWMPDTGSGGVPKEEVETY